MRHAESSRLKSQPRLRPRVSRKLIDPHDRIQVLKFSVRMVPGTYSNDTKAFGKKPLAALDFFSYSKQNPNGQCALSDSDILPGLCIYVLICWGLVLFSKLLSFRPPEIRRCILIFSNHNSLSSLGTTGAFPLYPRRFNPAVFILPPNIANSHYKINVLCLFNSYSFLHSVLSFHCGWIFL